MVSARPSRTRSIHFNSKHRSANAAPPFRPIQTRPAKYPALRSRMREIDAEIAEKFRAGRRHLAGFVAEDDVLVLDQPLGQADAEHAGDVVVTGAGVTQLVVETRFRLEPRRAFERDVHDAFQHLPDMGTGQAVIAMAALLHRHQKPRRGELAEMAAGGLRRHAGGKGQLGGGQRAAAEQRAQDIGAGRIADQSRDFGHLRCVRHPSNMDAAARHGYRQCFVRGRRKSSAKRMDWRGVRTDVAAVTRLKQ
jgi:hypothetical protein